jgi:predicted PurR-regulated permease PerM
MEEHNLPKGNIQALVFGALLVILTVLVCRLLAPFFTVLLWSILFYILLNPLHQRLTAKLNLNTLPGKALKNLIAGIFSLGTIILILIPLSLVASQFILQIIDLIRTVRNFIASRPGIYMETLETVSDFLEDFSAGVIVMKPLDIQAQILQALNLGTQSLIQISSSLAKNLGSFGVGIAFMLFCLFFFYLDGPYLSKLVFHVIPIRKDYMSALAVKFKDITRNLFLGYIMVALVQAVVGFIIFSIFGVQGALVFAALVLVCSFVPMFGAALVWFPLGLVRILGGDLWGGVLFLLISGVFISLLDNFLRPIFLQDRIRLHPLIIFLSILGGVQVFGFNGLVLGPMLVILFLTVLDMFLTEHKINLD